MKILSFDQSRCSRCGACQIVCSLVKKGCFKPEEARIRIEPAGEEESLSLTKPAGPALRAVVCQHCAEPVCVTACMRGIIHKDPESGFVSRKFEDCFRCASCQVLCPVGAAVEDHDLGAFITCDLCSTERKSGSLKGDVPACVQVCPSGALRYEDLSETSASLREQYARRTLGEAKIPEPDWESLSQAVSECAGQRIEASTLVFWSEELRKAADGEVR